LLGHKRKVRRRTDSRKTFGRVDVGLTGLRFSCAATMTVASSAHKSTARQLLALVRKCLANWC
jgi:hypothetical protein